jgi:hypothetical protein
VGTIKYVRIENAMEAKKRDGGGYPATYADLFVLDSTH